MVFINFFIIFVLNKYIIMDARINFNVKGLGFPTGKIYKMYIWVEDINEPGKYIDSHADEIKEQLKDICVVHSIEHTYTSYINSVSSKRKYGDIVLDKTIDIPTTKIEKNTNKVKIKYVTDIKKLDFPNIPKDDLKTLKDEVDTELFKREHDLSDDVYNFYIANMDLVDIEECKKICDKHGTSDLYILRKKEVRKKIEEKVLNN